MACLALLLLCLFLLLLREQPLLCLGSLTLSQLLLQHTDRLLKSQPIPVFNTLNSNTNELGGIILSLLTLVLSFVNSLKSNNINSTRSDQLLVLLVNYWLFGYYNYLYFCVVTVKCSVFHGQHLNPLHGGQVSCTEFIPLSLEPSGQIIGMAVAEKHILNHVAVAIACGCLHQRNLNTQTYNVRTHHHPPF